MAAEGFPNVRAKLSGARVSAAKRTNARSTKPSAAGKVIRPEPLKKVHKKYDCILNEEPDWPKGITIPWTIY